MAERSKATTRALLGSVAMVVLLLASGAPAAATADDCGGGSIELLQHDVDLATVVGARISGIGPACDGQPVGVQFLGNEAGDPSLPADELAHAYSDEDPCTGAERPDGVLRDGAVDVLLCEGTAEADHVDGEQLTRLRLITTAGTTTVEPDPTGDPPPATPDPPDAAPEPPARDGLPVTGAEILGAVLLGAALVLAGTGLVRLARHGRAPVR